jgi:signal transduction histidine kinase
MLKRIRHMKMSLAAKCQLLFGAAVVLIIAAALLVPWQRMEQLTDQITLNFARGLAHNAARQHAAMETARRSPATTQATPSSPADPRSIAPKLSLVHPRGKRAALSPFEERALRHFAADTPSTEHYLRQSDDRHGPPKLRYAWPLYADSSCIGCHASDLPPGAVVGTPPATAAASPAEKRGPLLAMVSVEVPPQVESFDILLNRVFLFTAGLLAGILAIAVFYLITTRLILRPVRVLQETAEKVSTGNLDIRSDISTGDEFQQLSETFNKMLANLKQGEDHLRAINKSLDLKMEELAQSNLALYESNRLKSEFLANVSHELRTPLNSILGFAELLRDGAVAVDAKTSRYVQNIVSSGRHLLDLINDLLDLAKIEAGKMDVRSEPFSLNDLFEGLTSIIRPLAQKKELSIATEVAPDVPILQSDGPKVQQVLYNFLSNAIKFSPDGGRIDLAARRANGQMVRIEVKDRGPGIDPASQAMIFEKFRQLDGSVTREHGGSGLGLAISKELVGLLGGSIGVDSRLGEGATFWIIVPLKTEARAQDLRQRQTSGAASVPDVKD